jgi:predicted KAP-like P-loop ATPase
MSTAHQTSFSDDRPIRSRAEDRLGRAAFADALAKAVHEWKGRESLVIALYGKWGAGKSSVKNMVREALEKMSPGASPVAEFNPWHFANRDQLTQAFFDQIGISIGRGSLATFKGRARLAARWRRYATYLRSGTDLIAAVRTPLAIALGVVAILVFGTSAFAARWIGIVVGAVLGVAALLVKWSARFAEAVQGLFAAGVEAGQKSLEEVRDELTEELRALAAPLLVIVDDIDRLTPNETAEMLQLVKANADFPNVVYLLLCDRETVEKSVALALQTSGREYLEKIVQVPFDLPAVEPPRLKRFLFEGLNELLRDEHVSKRFDEHRWGNLFLGGLDPYFDSLRDVNRFLSTLSFHIAVFKSDRAFEVNPIDLIALETLRVFEPDVYQLIQRSKSVLTQRGDRDRNDEAKAAITAVVDAAQKGHEDHVKEIVKQLFPPAEWAFGGYGYGYDVDESWERDLRVCSEDIFDRYFVLATPEGELSEAALSRILAATNDRAALVAELRRLAGEGLLPQVLDRLEAYKQKIEPARARPFITALFDLSEEIPGDRGGMFEISSLMHASRIVYWYLKQDAFSEAERTAIVTEAIRESGGVSLPVHVVSLELERQQKEDGDRFLDPAAMEAFKGLCVDNIRRAAGQGTLIRSAEFIRLLYVWREWGQNPDEVRRYCDALTATSEGALQLLEKFVLRSTSHGLGDYVSRTRWYVKLSVIETFASLEAIQAALANVDRATLPPERVRAIEALEKAIRRRAEGKPEYDVFGRD